MSANCTSDLTSPLRPSPASPRLGPEAAATADPPNPAPRVWACVVCYHPDLRAIAHLVDTVGPEVDCILLLDNAPEASEGLAGLAGPRIRHVPMTGNRGTAGAMNAAWQEALSGGAELMVSFDQDSIPVAGLVGGLVATFCSLTQEGIAVAAVGPLKTDPRTGQTMRVVLPGGFTKRDASARTTPIDVDHLVSSGCLISLAAFQVVGPFNEALFLDYVDIE